MGWSYKFWIDNFYPNHIHSQRFLEEYAKTFDTVEVDSTFYRVPSEETLDNWKKQTPDKFIFALKFPKKITHEKMLQNCQQETQFFLQRASRLQSKLGPMLLQLPPKFKSERLESLAKFLKEIPKEYRLAVEVRDEAILARELYDVLRENNVALTMTESPFMPKTEEFTTDFVYVRWEGDRKKVKGTIGKIESDRTENIREWANRISSFPKSIREIFGYFSKYYSGHPPTDAKTLRTSLAE